MVLVGCILVLLTELVNSLDVRIVLVRPLTLLKIYRKRLRIKIIMAIVDNIKGIKPDTIFGRWNLAMSLNNEI